MDLSFGARLRLQRERQQVPLTAIAEQTKIKVSLLDGLERDDISHWPGGIFRRSYVRAYAHAIGLEPQAVVDEFLAHYPDPVEDVPGALATRVDEVDVSRRPPTRLGYLISSAISALPALRPTPGGKGRDADGACPGDVPVAQAEPAVPALELTPVPEIDDGRDAEAMFMRFEAEAHDEPGAAGISIREVAEVIAPSLEAAAPERPSIHLAAVAALCTRLALAKQVREVTPVLADAVRLLDAVGLILWTWDRRAAALRPAISHGYSDQVLAQLPRVRPDADNAIAWAFRSADVHVVEGSERATGAVASPLMTPAGCAGVLALELRHGAERSDGVRALAAILAAQLATLVEAPQQLAEAVIA